MGLRNYFRGNMMDEAAAFKPALFTQFKLAVVAPLSGSDFENWADSSPLHHHNGCRLYNTYVRGHTAPLPGSASSKHLSLNSTWA